MTPAQRKQLIRHARGAVATRNYDALVGYVEAFAERARSSLQVVEPLSWHPDKRRSWLGRCWHRLVYAVRS